LSLTRRANQGHIAIIARNLKSPRGDIRGGLFVCLSPIGRRPHVTTPHLPAPCLRVGSEPPSELSEPLLAGARETRRPRSEAVASAARGPSGRGIRFAAGNDRARAIMPPLSSFEELPVTAYLISLTLAGLVAIAVWECLE